jgi:hypothetical protein
MAAATRASPSPRGIAAKPDVTSTLDPPKVKGGEARRTYRGESPVDRLLGKWQRRRDLRAKAAAEAAKGLVYVMVCPKCGREYCPDCGREIGPP